MATGNGGGGFNPGGNHLGVNLAFTKFLFVIPRRDDPVWTARLRAAGGTIARGFFNDFDADGTREIQPHETIHFYVVDDDHAGGSGSGIGAARYAVQVSGKYRPRLNELEQELRRRLGDAGDVVALDGAERNPRYTSSELYDYAYKRVLPRKSGRVARNVFVLPINKTAEWWQMSPLERHAFFYPHVDAGSGCPVHGHARTAQDGISTLYRRLYTTRTATSGRMSSTSSPTSSVRTRTSRRSAGSTSRSATLPETPSGATSKRAPSGADIVYCAGNGQPLLRRNTESRRARSKTLKE